MGATEKEIKKHYKKLSVKFHPDKLQVSANQTKEEIESYFVDITKAYKSLTDETIRKNFELYGHPDGRQEMSMGIALPSWVIESQNNIWVLGVYGLVFGIGLPYLVARWWYGSRSRTKDGLINATAQSFFQHLREDTPPARILALVAISEELQDPVLDKRGLGKQEADLDKMEQQVRQEVVRLGERWRLIENVSGPRMPFVRSIRSHDAAPSSSARIRFAKTSSCSIRICCASRRRTLRSQRSASCWVQRQRSSSMGCSPSRWRTTGWI